MDFSLSNKSLKNMAYELLNIYRKEGMPVFVCVGSDKYVCDSLAPIVAENLKKVYNIRAYVYGGLDYNINGTNISQAINYIETEHPYNSIVIIDATLGDTVGRVKLTTSCYPAGGRTLPIRKMGVHSILGVVGRNTTNFDLNTTRLRSVIKLSEFISKAVAMSLWYYLGSDVDRANIDGSLICWK